MKAIEDFVGITWAEQEKALFTHSISEIAELYGQANEILDRGEVLLQALQISECLIKIVTGNCSYRPRFQFSDL